MRVSNMPPPAPQEDDPDVPSLLPSPPPPSDTDSYPLKSSKPVFSNDLPDWALKINEENRVYNEMLESKLAEFDTQREMKEKKATSGRFGYGSSGQQGAAQGAAKSAAGGKLDLRFADEEDADEILEVVCSAYQFDRLILEEVVQNLKGGNKRWLIVETPSPEETMVAVARLAMEVEEGGTLKSALVDVLAVPPSCQSAGAGTFILKKAENVAKGMGCGMCNLSVGQWDDKIQKWVKARGYDEYGGELWPEAR